MTPKCLSFDEWIAKLAALTVKLESLCPQVQVKRIGALLDLRCDGLRGSVGIDFIRDPLADNFDVMKSRVELTNVDDLRGTYSASKVTAFDALTDALRVCDDDVRDIYVKIKEAPQ